MSEFIDVIYGWMVLQITQNDVFSGLVGGSVLMSVLYAARNVPGQIQSFLKFQFTVEVTVHNSSEAFVWMGEWLSRQPFARKSRRIQLSTYWNSNSEDENGNHEHWQVGLGVGYHFFRHNGNLFSLHHDINPGESGKDVKETYILRTLGRSQKPLLEIITEAKSGMRSADELPFYIWDGYWRVVAQKKPRGLDTVVLPEEDKTRIVADIGRFQGAATWYAERGVPYRRGYLLSGLPGTGKTSLVMALAGYFKKPICVLNLATMDDQQLQNAFWSSRRDAILLIEDIDAAQADRSVKQKKPRRAGAPTVAGAVEPEAESQSVSLSGLLNVIDGVAAPDGRILIMTTNHPEKLDSALIRPGRVDMRLDFGHMEPTQVQEMFGRFFPDMGIPITGRGNMTPAEVQGICMEYADDPDIAAQKLEVAA